MRERLFRGRRMYSEEWIYSTTIFAKGDSVYMPRPNTNYIITSHADIVGDIWQIECKRPDCFYRVDPSTIGQYTGLTANGKKIFEEDIIRANHDGVVGVVRFGEYMSPSDPDPTRHIGYYVDWQGKDKDFLRADLGYWASHSAVEVIGNIHDNSELLEDKPS